MKNQDEKHKNQIKSEITANILHFAADIVIWSEENIAKLLSRLPERPTPRDETVTEALHELEQEGVIHFIGASDIYVIPHPELLEPYASHESHAKLLRWVLETRLAKEA